MLKFLESRCEDVEFETGTCDLCFGTMDDTEETLVFIDTETKEEYLIENFYYTMYDNYLENRWDIDNYPKFAEWFMKQPVNHLNKYRHIKKMLDKYVDEVMGA